MRRFGEAANLLRVESRRLERRLGRMRDQLTAARGELSEQARLLQDLGISATSRMRGSAEELAGQMQIAEETAQGIEKAGSIVTTNLSTLLTALPQARSEEHTSELQTLMRISYAVLCLKKNKSKQQ